MAIREAEKQNINPAKVLEKILVERGSEDRLGIVATQVSPLSVASIVKQAASEGELGRLHELYLNMEATDARYAGLVNSIKSSIAEFPFRVFPGTTDSEAVRAADAVREMITRIEPSRLMRRLTNFYIRGISLHELMWSMREYDGQKYAMLVDTRTVPGSRLKMDTRERSKTYGDLMITSRNDPTGKPLEKFPYGKLLLQTDGTEAGFHDLGGAARRCLSWYLCKVYSQKYWAEFNETYGEPMRVGFYEDGDDQTFRDIRKFLEVLGRAMYGMFPEGTRIQLLESNRHGTIKTYNDLIQLANAEMAVAFFGSVQTVDGGRDGSFAKANVHNEVRLEIVRSVASAVNEALAEIVRYFILFNWGDSFPIESYPKARIIPNRTGDAQALADMFNTARSYIEIPKVHVYDSLGIPIPRDGEEVLEAPVMPTIGDEDDGEEEDRDGGSDEEDQDSDSE